MSLKTFVYISILVHVVGGAAIYLHYNPIDNSPKIISSFDEEILKEEVLKEEVLDNNPPLQKPIKKRKKFRKKNKIVLPEKSEEPSSEKPSLENQIVQNQNTKFSLPKEPLPNKLLPKEPITKSQSPQKKSESPKISAKELQDREEVEELEKSQAAKTKSPLVADEASGDAKKAQDVLKKIDLEAMEEVEVEEEEVVSAQTAKTKSNNNSIAYKSIFDLKQKRGNPEITYPEFARKGNLQGKMTLHYYVTKEGLVDKISLKQSSGHSEIDNHVLRLVSRYEFLANQESWVEHEVNFALEGKEEERINLRQK